MIYCSHYDKPEQRRQRWRICQTATGEECVPKKWHDLSWTMHYTREQVFPCRAARTICNVHFNQQTQLSCNLCQELQRTVCHYYAHKKLDIGFFQPRRFFWLKFGHDIFLGCCRAWWMCTAHNIRGHGLFNMHGTKRSKAHTWKIIDHDEFLSRFVQPPPPPKLDHYLLYSLLPPSLSRNSSRTWNSIRAAENTLCGQKHQIIK